MTADAAVRRIREVDVKGTIALFSDEQHPPYKRPPLSKGLWKEQSEKDIWRKAEFTDVSLHLGLRFMCLDADGNIVTNDHAQWPGGAGRQLVRIARAT